MKRNLKVLLLIISLSLQTLLHAQNWTSPVLAGSVPVSGNTYYIYNVGSAGYLNQGGYWKTQAVVSSFPYANASTTLIKWTLANTSGTLWTFQLNSGGANQSGKYLFPANASATDGSVYTDNSTNNSWNLVQTDATNNIYSIQIISSYGGYVATQYLGTELNPEVGNATSGNGASGTFNAVRYNRAGSAFTQWKFISQSDLDLYNAKVVLDRYMRYARSAGNIDLTSYISTYNAGVTADISVAASNLLTTLGRTTVSITNGSFESATGVNTTISAWTNSGTFQNQSNTPGTGWTKDGTYYCEKFIASAYGTNGKGVKAYLPASVINQTVSVPNGLYGLVVSGHAVQQAGANPLHTGAFISAASSVTEISSGSDYYIDSINVTNGSLALGYTLTGTIQVNWTGFDNFRLYRYVTYSTPSVAASVNTLSFDNQFKTSTFSVLGTNLTSDITISGVPSGITLSGTNVVNTGSGTYRIAQANANATNIISVSYDGSTTISLSTISITASGNGATTATTSFTLKGASNSSCFSTLYTDKTNLITDSYMSSLTTYTASWGVGTGLKLDSTVVYCGKFSAKVTGQRAGSLTYNLSGIWKPNTKYRLKAKIYTPDASRFDLWVSGWSAASSDIGASLTSSTLSYTANVTGVGAGTLSSGQWNDVDFTFITGTLSASNQYFYFNNFTNNVSGTSYIDNIELYEIERYVSSSSNLSALTSANSTNEEVVINTGNELTVDATDTIKSVIVNPGAKLTINSGSTLATSGLTLTSDSTGTGTFVNKNTNASIQNASVQQYLTSGRNWYISSPISNATAGALSTAGSVVRYDEPSASWMSLSGAEVLTPTVGYISSATTSTGIISFSGTLNDGTYTIYPTRTYGVAKAGFNLIGNPYPSYLSWDQVTLSSNVSTTMWYRSKNPGNTAYVFDTYNSVGQVGTSNNGSAVTSDIPPMQAFWVRVDVPVLAHDTTGIVIFNNSMRAHKGATDVLMRTPAVHNATQQLVRLQVSNGVNRDETIILFNPNATDGLDDYDSYKMTNNNRALPEIYTSVGTDKLVINGLSSVDANKVLPLGFTTGESNTFTIQAISLNNMEGTDVVLYDNQTQTQANLSNGEVLTFSSDSTNTASRFSLLFKSSSLATNISDLDDKSVAISVVNGKIQFNSNLKPIAGDGLSLFNALGRKIVEMPLNQSNAVIDSPVVPGVYVLRYHLGGTDHAVRVIVK